MFQQSLKTPKVWIFNGIYLKSRIFKTIEKYLCLYVSVPVQRVTAWDSKLSFEKLLINVHLKIKIINFNEINSYVLIELCRLHTVKLVNNRRNENDSNIIFFHMVLCAFILCISLLRINKNIITSQQLWRQLHNRLTPGCKQFRRNPLYILIHTFHSQMNGKFFWTSIAINVFYYLFSIIYCDSLY